MYHAKEAGATISVLQGGYECEGCERQSVEGSLRRALERQEFLLHYQPKVKSRHG